MPTKIEYDLNVFQRENIVGKNAKGEYVYDYVGPWYIDIYEVDGATHRSLDHIIQLTDEEAKTLQLGDGYFEYPDTWIGLDEFLKHYSSIMSESLTRQLDWFPRYKEESLF